MHRTIAIPPWRPWTRCWVWIDRWFINCRTKLRPCRRRPRIVEALTQLALRQRPDLQALDYDQQAAVKFSHAQRDQMFPTISAAGTAGSVPIRPDQYYVSSWWGAIGINMNIPIFNGFLYSAQAKEAARRAQASAENSRDLRDRIVRDVRTFLAGRQYRIPARQRHGRTVATGEPRIDSGPNQISVGVEFHRGTQPGAVPANRCRNWQCKCAVSIPAYSGDPQLSNRRNPMIENFKSRKASDLSHGSVTRRAERKQSIIPTA